MCPGDFSSHILILQWANTIQLYRTCLVRKNGHHDIAVELFMLTSYNSLPYYIAPRYQHLIYFGFMLWSFYVDTMLFFFMLNFITLKFIKQELHWYTHMLFASPWRVWCSFIATYRSWPISKTYQKQQLHPRQDCLRVIASFFDPS